MVKIYFNCFFTQFYPLVTLCKKIKKFPHWLLKIPKNLILGPWPAHFGPKTLKQSYSPQKNCLPHFKSLCYYNFMQKLRKVPCTDFWWYLKNLTSGPFQVTFDPKTSKQSFCEKVVYASFKPKCYCNFTRQIRKNPNINFS